MDAKLAKWFDDLIEQRLNREQLRELSQMLEHDAATEDFSQLLRSSPGARRA